MAVPTTIAELRAAIKTRLSDLTWPSDSSDLFPGGVITTAAFIPEQLPNILDNYPACLVVKGQETTHEENEEFQTTRWSVFPIVYYPMDKSGAMAIEGDKGLDAMIEQIRTSMKYLQETLDSEVHWVETGGGQVLVRGDVPGASYVGQEIQFDVFHMTNT